MCCPCCCCPLLPALLLLLQPHCCWPLTAGWRASPAALNFHAPREPCCRQLTRHPHTLTPPPHTPKQDHIAAAGAVPLLVHLLASPKDATRRAAASGERAGLVAALGTR